VAYKVGDLLIFNTPTVGFYNRKCVFVADVNKVRFYHTVFVVDAVTLAPVGWFDERNFQIVTN
jgi:hypothetical protein